MGQPITLFFREEQTFSNTHKIVVKYVYGTVSQQYPTRESVARGIESVVYVDLNQPTLIGYYHTQ